MVLTAPFVAPALTRQFPAPPAAGVLGTIQLVGDMHFYVPYPQDSPVTIYDAVGLDIRDRLTGVHPDVSLQMGDLGIHGSQQKIDNLLGSFEKYKAWVKRYTLNGTHPWHNVMGNHDTPGLGSKRILDAQGWADYWGYAKPSYAIEFPNYRILVLNPTGSGDDLLPVPSASIAPVRPLTDDDVAWVDLQLASSSKPTILATHAPLWGMPTRSDNTEWSAATSSLSGGYLTTDLFAVMNAHPNLIGMVVGHTHSQWNTLPANVSSFNIGSRNITLVDAGSIFQDNDLVAPGQRNDAVTFYLSVMDDGRTIEVRWRDHDHSTWAAVDGLNRKFSSAATGAKSPIAVPLPASTPFSLEA